MLLKYCRKPYRVKKKKSILRNRFLWRGVLTAAAIGAILYFIFFSGMFQVQKVIIIGASKIPKESIEALVPRGNILLIDAPEIKREILNNFLQISAVKINKSLPHTLNIQLTERLAVAVWCDEENCFLTDSSGVIFEKILSPGQLEGLIKIVGSREMLDKDKISLILNIQPRLNNLSIAVSRASLVSEKRLDIKTSEGWEIYFNLQGDLSWQITELGLVLSEQIPPEERGNLEYVDLRFSRVYYKFR